MERVVNIISNSKLPTDTKAALLERHKKVPYEALLLTDKDEVLAQALRGFHTFLRCSLSYYLTDQKNLTPWTLPPEQAKPLLEALGSLDNILQYPFMHYHDDTVNDFIRQTFLRDPGWIGNLEPYPDSIPFLEAVSYAELESRVATANFPKVHKANREWTHRVFGYLISRIYQKPEQTSPLSFKDQITQKTNPLVVIDDDARIISQIAIEQERLGIHITRGQNTSIPSSPFLLQVPDLFRAAKILFPSYHPGQRYILTS